MVNNSMSTHTPELKLIPVSWMHLHYRHVHEKVPIRKLARMHGLIPSTVMRRIRQAESLADVDIGAYVDPGLLYRDIIIPLAASDEAT